MMQTSSGPYQSTTGASKIQVIVDSASKPNLGGRPSSPIQPGSRPQSLTVPALNLSQVEIAQKEAKRHRQMRQQLVFWTSYHLLVSTATVIIGALYLDSKHCTLQKIIPTYLVISGSAGSLRATILGILFWVSFIKQDNFKVQGDISTLSKYVPLLDTFIAVWFVMGCLWHFSKLSTVQYADPASDTYCHEVLFKFCFVYLLSQAVMLPTSWILALLDYFRLPDGEDMGIIAKSTSSRDSQTSIRAPRKEEQKSLVLRPETGLDRSAV